MVYEPSREWFFPPVRPDGKCFSHGVNRCSLDQSLPCRSQLTVYSAAHAGLGPLSDAPNKDEQIEFHAWELINILQRFASAVAKTGPPGVGKAGNSTVGRKDHAPSSDSEDEDQDEVGLIDLVVQGAEVGIEEKEREMRRDGWGKRERKKEVDADRKRARDKRDALVGRMARVSQDMLGDGADALEVFAK